MSKGFTVSAYEKEFKAYGQDHILENDISLKEREAIKAGIDAIPDFDSYIKRARKLLEESKNGANPFEGYKVEVPKGVSLDLSSSQFIDNETIGLSNITKTAFVLVAGGLGERLGYEGIKLALPTDLATGSSHLQLYIEYLLSYAAYNAPEGSHCEIPLVIMTSDDTHNATVELLEKNNFYGANPAQISFIKQTKVPALINNEAHVAFTKTVVNGEEVITGIETKPHGHGDVHSLLANNKSMLQEWSDKGVEHVIFIQDTNSLIFNGIPAALGVSINEKLTMNTITVPRVPGEAVGAIAKLTKEDGTSMTINVEYNQLSPLLKSQGQADVAADKETGYSAFPGNTNSFIVNLKRYAEVLEETGGLLGEFVNPKYADETKEVFKSPVRLECLMQDLPKGFTKQDDKVGFTQFPRWLVFSAVKNSVAEAIKKIESGLLPECALSAEADRYACFEKILKAAVTHSQGVFETEPAVEKTFLGVTYKMGPKIIIHPSFATSYKQVLERVAGAYISIKDGEVPGSATLVLKGNCAIIRIEAKGAFICDGAMVKTGREWAMPVDTTKEPVNNRGWFFEATVGSTKHLPLLPAALRIRGYTLHKAESKLVHITYVDEKKKVNQKACWC
eukprot:GDKJ01028354.1.p1 GENE.GDKJ01028354.1~~GDKJ01028354.1.p1  ORF type:complete len:620 (+),score=192.87 GDKJ01028354.1:33-1892(+)